MQDFCTKVLFVVTNSYFANSSPIRRFLPQALADPDFVGRSSLDINYYLLVVQFGFERTWHRPVPLDESPELSLLHREGYYFHAVRPSHSGILSLFPLSFLFDDPSSAIQNDANN